MKRFPIIKFYLREDIDNKKVQPVPRSFKLPTWVLGEKELNNRINKLNNDMDNIKKELNIRNANLPKIIRAKISKDAIAKSYRKNINSVFTNESNDILGMHKKQEILYSISDDSVNIIKQKITENFGEYAISAIESIDFLKPEINLEDNTNIYKMKLIDFNRFTEVEEYFLSKCKTKNIQVDVFQYTDKMKVYATNKETCLDILDDDELTQCLYEVEPMPFFKTTTDSIIAEVNFEKYEKKDEDYINVGVLDTGIKELDINKDWLMEDKKICYNEEDIDRDHGTMVSTVLLYGDKMVDSPIVNALPVNIFDATVFSKSNPSEYELILNIKEAISKNYNNVKIWNLSLGTKNNIKEDKFSDFAMVLDELQSKYNILICKSAGNFEGEGENRICNGADSILSIVVGSLANKESVGDMVKTNTPSAFSRIGRAPANIIKPDVVHYGGNCKEGVVNPSGIKTINSYGQIVEVAGTSFSTPRITSLAASIQSKLNIDNVDPILLKALIVHSAKIPNEMNGFDKDDIIKTVGFGLPMNANDILTELESKTTLILRDKIKKKRYIEILDFPFPDNLSDESFYKGRITVTLVSKPYLDQLEGVEYCQSDINLEFGTYNQSGIIGNILEEIEVKKEKSKNLLNNSYYTKKAKMSENYLIQYKNKYYPVKKYIIDLDKMTDANKNKYLTKDKKWYLKLSQLFREKIEREYSDHLEDLEQEFCLIISFEDLNNEKSIHDEVIKKLIKNNFIHENIDIKSSVSIYE